ncbi:MAG TPA: DinB family protein [Planctomycetota bacterium]|nr:DinB family protein [Planctomycetota bacterium]
MPPAPVSDVPLLSLALDRLRRSADAIAALVRGLPLEAVRWKPAPERWSALEVVCHLGDEEVLDFRTRVRLTLQDPAAPWPPIEPSRWVVERRYLEQPAGPALARFLNERAESISWLAAQREARWDNAHEHPQAGPLTARCLLANWMAHDLLHLRQLARLEYESLAARGEALDYAGPWT